LIQQTQAGYSRQEIINIFIETASYTSKDIIKEGALNELIYPLITLHKSTNINNEIEKKILFIATLKKFDNDIFLENLILKNNLFKLCNLTFAPKSKQILSCAS